MKYKYNNFDTLHYDADESDSSSAENVGGVSLDESLKNAGASAVNAASSARNALKGAAKDNGKTEAGKSLGKGSGNGKAEVNKMKNDNASRKRSGAANAKGASSGAKSANGGKSGATEKSNESGSASGVSANRSAQDAKSQDNGGKYDMKKAYLNKFKFKLQKNSAEEEKAEAEANRCDPCNEFKAGNGLDFGCIDWGKCAFMKPCCKKAPYPCGCFAYMCFGITFIGGLISSILLF